MRVRSLHLTQFRSYAEAAVPFPDAAGCVALLGENGAGKTNIIEALSILSLTRSCRGSEEGDIVRWDQPFYRLKAETIADDGTIRTVEVVSERTPRKRKTLFVNDVQTSASAFVGLIPTVTFLPQDLLLFSGSPAERRRFLDQLLSQVSPEYLETLSRYQHVLQQRNALLKTLAQTRGEASVLDVWDQELARYGSMITRQRLELIETLMLSYTDELARLGEQWDDVRVSYERKTAAREHDVLERELRTALRDMRERDIAVQSTLVGPHREDWHVHLNGRELSTFASRGQERAAVLALLFLQVAYLQLKRGEMPVLLLDDACSELDERHQQLLLSGFPGAQVVLTATRLPDQAQPVATFRIEPGVIAESF